ncbi:MAG: NAD-specific glutamate dehydrogenase [Candidatus Saccharicenans subterraneus]|uniref:NAD-specific glutamate dehydrogenase n=1 Tax=Candidatus Saccharicenans subterraneus TaxID=2508984 RepID=A0A3E2BQG9_9BACT|nr:MAG: NAD-specific glutamate dehydrogenase [Candidatus Saccharicenans subterraneum]
MKSLKEIAKKTFLTENQLKKIEEIILKDNFFAPETVREEIETFCTDLGLSEQYFESTPLVTIARHIEALRSAEILARLRGEQEVRIDFATELADEALYLVEDNHYRAIEIEEKIEKKYPGFRVQSYRSARKLRGAEYLRWYVVCKPEFVGKEVSPEETDLKKIADKEFLASIPKETLARYQELMNKAKDPERPYIDVAHVAKDKTLRISVVCKSDSIPRFFINVSDVINSHGLVSKRKYMEHFANGKTILTFYLDDITDEEKLRDLVSDISLIYVIPESPLSALFREGKLTAQEMLFGASAWSFTHQFLSSFNEEYLKLSQALKDNPELLGLLREMKTRLAKETFTEDRVWDALINNYLMVKKLFELFDRKFNPAVKDHKVDDQLQALAKEINREIPVEADRTVLLTVITFIKSILRTNFYKKEKVSIAYMYSPDFLNKVDYPVTPFGVFHVIGRELRGFHIRFRDIARGGIRIVRSINYQTYLNNSDFIFDENYNLALTQQRKNKDLAEGGSKGTILLRWGFTDKMSVAFKKYIDGLLDLMMPDNSIVDYYGKEVILFLGPDEWTADLMEWAAQRARVRGYKFWKAFTTGKPLSMGGIPHDRYGMTTNSVHEYVLCALKKLGLKEENITKVMTGGPDGDLGSNEILISKDKILAIIDGSGVLYDPEGINRKELVRLAKARKMVENFNRSLLSPQGFMVNIKDRDLVLPDGEKVENGLEFRNTFHLHPKFRADIFVPCGGRPASININNWKCWLDAEGKPRFKVIVEGANLFLTQEARLRLEEKGVIIYKDASANKGGVTSSSLEVLASLAMTDKEWDELMCVKNGEESPFRKQYVNEIIDVIRENARLEFEIIWKEHERTGIPRAILTDLISEKINLIKDAINNSDLFNDQALLEKVIEVGVPKSLVRRVGINRFLTRVPQNYLRALFASRLAGRYVYQFGLQANEVDFYRFISDFKKASK